MKRVKVAAFSLMLLSSVLLAGRSYSASDDDVSLTPSPPKKVNMRAVQAGNLPANLDGKQVTIVTESKPGVQVGKFLPSNQDNNVNNPQTVQLQGVPGKPGQVMIVTDSKPGMQVGKYLPSNRDNNANNPQTVQLQEVPGKAGQVMVIEDSGKKNYKNINQRTDEVMGKDNF